MKRIINRLLLLTIVFAVFSCVIVDPPEPVASYLQVSNIQDRQVSVSVKPCYADRYYYWDVLETAQFDELHDTIGEYYLHHWQSALGQWREGDPDKQYTKIEDFMYQGTSSEDEWDVLRPDRTYVLFAYYPDSNYHATMLTWKVFTTARPQMLTDAQVFFTPNRVSNPYQLRISSSMGGERWCFIAVYPLKV